MEELVLLPGMLGSLGVMLKVVLAKWALQHSSSSLEKGKEGKGIHSWDVVIVL